MNSNSTVITTEIVEEAIQKWNSAVSNFDGNELKIKTEAFFNTMTDAGLDNGFIDSYYGNNEALKTALESSATVILSTLKNMEGLDQAVKNDILSMLGEKPTRPAGGSGSSSGGGTESSTSVPTETQLIDNSKDQLTQYANMSMSDLYNVAAELTKLADENSTTLEHILSGEEYTLQIHNALLASQNIPSEFKQMIESGNTSISQKLLSSIFQGENPEIVGINDNTTMAIREYLNMVAANNNISLEQLLTDSNYRDLLKDSVSTFNNIPNYIGTLNDDNIVNSLLDIYDGNSIDGMGLGEVSIVRSFIDTSAQTANTDVESMLYDTGSIKDEINSLGKASVFMNTLTKFSDDASNSILNTLIGLK